MSANWLQSAPIKFDKLGFAKAADTWVEGGSLGGQRTDGRCDGGYVNAPPSIRGVGKAYRWLVSLQHLVRAAPEAPIRAWTIEAFLYRMARNT